MQNYHCIKKDDNNNYPYIIPDGTSPTVTMRKISPTVLGFFSTDNIQESRSVFIA